MTELDHLVLPVSDLDAAAAAFTDAGFVVTPEAAHPFGTANRLVVFEGVYLELVCVADPSRLPDAGFGRQVATHLETQGRGFSHFACRALSRADAASQLTAAGLVGGEPVRFSRPAPRTDGSEPTARFTLVPIGGDIHQFFCTHHTPEAIWFRPHVSHSNGVRRIARVASRLRPSLPIVDVTEGPDGVAFDTETESFYLAGVRFG